MNLKCGYFTVGGIMCGSLVGIFVGALAVNASLGYMILLLGAWGLCLYITSRSLMDDARREETVLNQPAEEFDDPDELPPLYWEGYDRGYEDALESIIDNDLVLDDLKTDIVEVKLWDAQSSGAFPAVREECYIEVSSYGGDTTGYQIPFNVHYTGVKTKGTFNPTTKAFTAEA
ncbi:hypothetical protein [Gemmiger formicilis]|uniref:hypothetical protein n=1 Tax=Gemmiger formicilis TaxID=745368 RepID=UPI003079335D